MTAVQTEATLKPGRRGGVGTAKKLTKRAPSSDASVLQLPRGKRGSGKGDVSEPHARRVGTARREARPEPFETMVGSFISEARRKGLGDRVAKLPDPVAFGAQLAEIADARATWEAALGRYLTVAEAAKVLGVSSRQAVHQRIERGTLLAMSLGGVTVLPVYQFEGSAVRSEVVHVIKLLSGAKLSAEAIVSWFASPQPELDGARPSDYLGRDAVRLYGAARHTAGSLAH